MKTKPKIIALIFSAILFSEMCFGQVYENNFWGQIKEKSQLTTLIDFRSAYEFDSRKMQKLELFARPELEISFSRNIYFKAIGRIYYESQDRLEPGEPGQAFVSDFSKRGFLNDNIELELREFYVDWKIDRQYLTLGKQQIVWGKTDGLKILDVVNPTNFREFLLDDFENSRIPLWSAKIDLKIKKIKAQLVWIPDLTYHEIPPVDGTFSFLMFQANSFRGFSIVQKEPQIPDDPIKDSDFGIRLSTFYKGWDLAVNYFNHNDDFPIVEIEKISNATILLTTNFKRYNLFGGSFSNAFGSFSIRGEIGYIKDKYFFTGNLDDKNGHVKSDQINSAIGLEYSGFSNTLVSMQWFEDYLFEDIALANRKQEERYVSFLVNRNFMNETLTAEAILVQNINQGDGFVSSKIKYYLLSNLILTAGGDFFFGDKHRFIGQFKKHSRLIFSTQLGF